MRLTVRQTRLLLWFAATLLAMGSITAVVLLIALPYDLPGPSTPSAPRSVSTSQHTTNNTELASFQRHWSLDLQQPLFDPPPVKVQKAPPPPPPPLRLRLLGIVTEPDNTQAILMTTDDRLHFAKVGDTIDAATIQAITPNRVQLIYHGQQVSLVLEGE